jgi:hypothetical protein
MIKNPTKAANSRKVKAIVFKGLLALGAAGLAAGNYLSCKQPVDSETQKQGPEKWQAEALQFENNSSLDESQYQTYVSQIRNVWKTRVETKDKTLTSFKNVVDYDFIKIVIKDTDTSPACEKTLNGIIIYMKKEFDNDLIWSVFAETVEYLRDEGYTAYLRIRSG